MRNLSLIRWLEDKNFVKESDYALVGILLCRIISTPLTFAFIKIKFRPNYITTLALVSVTVGAYCVLVERLWLASLFIGFGAILDFCDGMVARYLKISSKLGGYYDYIADRLKSLILFSALIGVSEGVSLKVLFGSAIFFLLFKEVLAWFCPYERMFEKYGIPTWKLFMGRFSGIGCQVFRNDPWQLVFAALLGCVFGGLGLMVGLAYYATTTIVDALALFRAHFNVFAPIDIGYKHILMPKQGFSYRAKAKRYLSKLLGLRVAESERAS